MNDQKVMIVTGCSGRIGTLVAKRFGEAGYTVVGFDIVPPHEDVAKWIDFYKVDLSSDQSVEENLEKVRAKHGGHITSVIHLAAYYSFAGEHPELYDKITVQGTARMLRGVKKFQSVEQFLFSSTQLVYAPCAVGSKVSENSPIDAKWDYPKSKVKTEKVMREEHGNIPIVILRIAGCYDDDCHSIPISNQIQRIFEDQLEARLFPGDLTHGSPFLHLNDLVDSIWLAVEKRGTLPNELILLIGEGKTLSYGEMQDQIWKLLDGRVKKTIAIPKWFAKSGAWVENQIPGFHTFIKPWMIDIADDNYTLDVSKAKEILGWEPKHFVGTTLPVMIEKLKSDPIAWYKTNGLEISKKIEEKYAATASK